MIQRATSKIRLAVTAAIVVIVGASCATPPGNPSARFDALVDEAYADDLAADPTRRTESMTTASEAAWTPVTLAHDELLARKYRSRLAQLSREVHREELSADIQARYDIFRSALENQLVRLRIKRNGYTYSANVFDPPRELPELLIRNHKIVATEDARNYISRLQALPGILDDVTADARELHRRGIVMVDREYRRVADDARARSEGAPCSEQGENSLAADFRSKLVATSMTGAERDKLLQQANEILTTAVCPAYARFSREVVELGKRGRSEGLWALPTGNDVYRDMIELTLMRRIEPDAIHQWGLQEVERQQRDIEKLTAALGIEGGASQVDTATADKPELWVPNTEAGYQKYLAFTQERIARIQARLPDYFQYVPRTPLAVEWAATGPTGGGPSRGSYYTPAPPDGSKPAVYNLAFYPGPPRFSFVLLPTATYHEAVPGHHMQMATAFELQGREDRLRFGRYVSYAEGWAMYAERLAFEMGAYADDPYGEIGWRRALLERAVRLVIDTGVNYEHWSRQQAEAYQVSVVGGEPNVNRFFDWPGQALGYYYGYQEFLQLRDRAQQALGEKFDIKAFHHAVLKDGEMPLDVLERAVDRYIAATQHGTRPPGR